MAQGTGTITALNGTVIAATDSESIVVFNVTGTWSATLGIQATIDGTNWFAVNGYTIPQAIVTAFSTNQAVIVSCSGFLQIQLIATAFTSGTINVAWSNSNAGVVFPVGPSLVYSLQTAREDYVVGTSLNNYTGSTTLFNLNGAYVPGSNTLLITVDGDVQTNSASVDYVETNTTTVTFNNALVTGQHVSFIYPIVLSTSISAQATNLGGGSSGAVPYQLISGSTLFATPGANSIGYPLMSNGATNAPSFQASFIPSSTLALTKVYSLPANYGVVVPGRFAIQTGGQLIQGLGSQFRIL